MSSPFKAVSLQLGGFTEELSTLEISSPEPTPDTRSSISCAILPSSVLEVVLEIRDTKSLEQVSYRRGAQQVAGIRERNQKPMLNIHRHDRLGGGLRLALLPQTRTRRGENYAEEPPVDVDVEERQRISHV